MTSNGIECDPKSFKAKVQARCECKLICALLSYEYSFAVWDSNFKFGYLEEIFVEMGNHLLTGPQGASFRFSSTST